MVTVTAHEYSLNNYPAVNDFCYWSGKSCYNYCWVQINENSEGNDYQIVLDMLELTTVCTKKNETGNVNNLKKMVELIQMKIIRRYFAVLVH